MGGVLANDSLYSCHPLAAFSMNHEISDEVARIGVSISFCDSTFYVPKTLPVRYSSHSDFQFPISNFHLHLPSPGEKLKRKTCHFYHYASAGEGPYR